MTQPDSPISSDVSRSAPNAGEQAVIRKVLRRLIPFCMLCYLMNYIDRVNVSVARLTMVFDPKTGTGIDHLTAAAFDIGTAVFFIGYCLFELPSNLLQEKVGARRWIARIMISWGVLTICLMLTRGPASFQTFRLLLGFAEAGFFPGMILYLSYWVPHRYRARASALFLTSTAISGVIGNPLGGLVMYLTKSTPLGLQPWQWLFLCEGVPAVVLGVMALFYLTDKPADARWLSNAERQTLTRMMARERALHPAHGMAELKHAFASVHTWILSALYGLIIFAFYIVNFYTPQIIKDTLKASGIITATTASPIVDLWTCLLAAIPFGAAAVGMVLIGRHSDRANERKLHLAFTCGLSCLGMMIAAVGPSFLSAGWGTAITIAGLSIGAIGAFGMFGPFWALPPQLLTGTAAAASVAIINSIGNFIGGYGGPTVRPYMTQTQVLLLSAAMAFCGLLLALFMPIPRHVSPNDRA